MDDLISRQAAIEALIELYEYQRDIDPTEAADLVRRGICLAEKKIEQLPSAQQWISCEERLPESYTDVLVWFEYYRYGDYNRLYQMHGIGTYIKEYDSWIINHETGWRKLRVFAWMPLPEPWEGEEHGASRTMLPKKSLC